MSEYELTPLDHLYRWEQDQPDRVYLRQPRNRQWREYTWKEVADTARRMAAALQDQGVEKGSRVAILSKNCAEWIMADLAIMMSGAISVPLYPMQSDDAVSYVLEHSGASVIFVGKLDNSPQVRAMLPDSITQIGFNYEGTKADLMWDDLVRKYEPTTKPYHPELDDTFTIVYTSGTTGNPKGVVHDFRSATFVAVNGIKEFGLSTEDRSLSFLPLAHVAERVLVEIPSIYGGMVVSFAESLDTFAEDIRLVEPTRFFSVPRLWTKFQMGILEKVPQEKLDKILGIPLLGWFVKRKIRKGLGLHKADMFISGAAPLPVSVMEFFSRLGINIQEGYGMTENWAYGSINRREDIRVGSVGQLMTGGEVKISDDGEILLRSPATMKGYYLDDEKTAEVICDEGYYHTGDAGEVCSDGFIKITGRIKDTFKTSKGEFITPTIIENLLSQNTSIEQLCIVGLGMPQPMALVVLSEHARSRPKAEVTKELEATHKEVNAKLKSHEVINGMIVVKGEWSPEDGFMTPTLKVKRNEVFSHYKDILEKNAESKAVVWE